MEDIRMDYSRYIRLKTEFVNDLAIELDDYMHRHFRYSHYTSNRKITFSGFDNNVAFISIEYDYRETGWEKPERFIFKTPINQNELFNYKKYDVVTIVRMDLIYELDKFIKMKGDEVKMRLNSYYGMYIDTDIADKRRKEFMSMFANTRSDYDRLIEGNIKEVIYNADATIVLWRDGTKTVVKRQKGDRHDPEKAFAMCIIKKLAGNTGSYYDIFKQHVPAKYVERKK